MIDQFVQNRYQNEYVVKKTGWKWSVHAVDKHKQSYRYHSVANYRRAVPFNSHFHIIEMKQNNVKVFDGVLKLILRQTGCVYLVDFPLDPQSRISTWTIIYLVNRFAKVKFKPPTLIGRPSNDRSCPWHPPLSNASHHNDRKICAHSGNLSVHQRYNRVVVVIPEVRHQPLRIAFGICRRINSMWLNYLVWFLLFFLSLLQLFSALVCLQ